MVFPKARVGVAAALFIGWILYLAYLVAVTRDPIVVSRPQILVADLCVLAKIDADDGRPVARVTVTEILWSADDAKALVGQTLNLADLVDLAAPSGWAGAGEYLLPLTKKGVGNDVSYELTAIPPMPGFRPATVDVELVMAGPKREQVADYLRKALSITAQQADAMTQAPTTLKRFASTEAAGELRDELSKLGARVQLLGSETRIYRATDDVRRQLRELKP